MGNGFARRFAMNPKPIIALLFIFLALVKVAEAAPWTLTVRAENDVPANADQYYTNGVALSFARCVSEEDVLLPALLRLPGLRDPGIISQGFDLGQIMVTPANTATLVPDPRDRPYAGLLYFGATWQRSRPNRFAAFKIITGVVGPSSLAEQTQREIHKLIDSPIAQGWDYQLRDEPIINVVYEQRWRAASFGSAESFGGDTLLVAGGMLGNVLTQAYGHAQFRYGWRVPRDFGTSLIRGIGVVPPARDGARWSVHAFIGTGAFAVARNITLDGNTFRDSRSVKKNPFVPAIETGVVVRVSGWQLVVSWVAWGREFENQPRHAEFGTISFSLLR